MDRCSDNRRTLLVCGLLSAGTLAVFWGLRSHDFIVYDDQAYVVGNLMVRRGLTWAGTAWAFTSFDAANWHPLTWLSHMLDCQLYGVQAGGHHFTSLLLHSANAGLLCLALKRLTGALWRSALVAALFALHPLHVESFAWVAERKDVLSAFFFMLTLWAYAHFVGSPKSEVRSPKEARNPKSEARSSKGEKGGWLALPSDSSPSPPFYGRQGVMPWSVVGGLWSVVPSPWSLSHLPSSIFYLLTLFFFACGLMSKPMLVTVPFVLLLLDYWPLGRTQRSEVRGQRSEGGETLHAPPSTAQSQIANRESQILFPFLVEKLPFFALSAGSCIITCLAQSRGGAVETLQRVSLAARLTNALVGYLGYLEKMVWPTNLSILYLRPPHWPLGRILLAVVVLGGISLLVLVLQRSANRPGSQWTTNGAAAERYSGFPDKGTCCEPGRFALRPWLIIGWLWFLGMLVPVSGLMQVGNQYMADRYSYLPLIGLFIIVVWGGWEVAADGSWRKSLNGAFNPRGAMDAEKANKAGRTCSQPVKNSDHGSRGLHGFSVSEQSVQSEVNFGCGLAALRPSRLCDSGGAPFSAGTALRCAICGLAAAVLIILGAVAVCQVALWQNSETIFGHCLAVTPNNHVAHSNLGVALAQQGRNAEAKAHFLTAWQIQPHDADTLYNMGVLLTDEGRFDEAAPYLAEAVGVKPEMGAIYSKLGLLLDARGLPAQAIACYREGLRFRPSQMELANNLAWLLATTPDARLRDGGEAVRLALQACEASGYKQALVVGTLAAAYAEAGRFQEAVTTAQQAITLATAAGQPELADRNRQLLELYRAGKPVREKTTRDERR